MEAILASERLIQAVNSGIKQKPWEQVGKEQEEVTTKGYGISFWGDWSVLKLNCCNDCTTLYIY